MRLRRFNVASVLGALAVVGCSSGQDETRLLVPELGSPGRDVAPFLGLPETAAESADSPPLLSETLAFSELESLQAAPGILPYTVQSPLWSDGAQKQRWMALPSGAHIGFAERGAWRFPEGTVFIKHFGMALDERAPDVVERLETRFLVAARGGGYYGLVYKWDADQRDARLLLDGAEDVLEIVQADGTLREQRYTYPGQQSCAACHSAAAGYVMGPRAAQLAGELGASGDNIVLPEGYPEAGGESQLASWARLDLFEAPIGDIALDERLAPLDDAGTSVETRIRSYWDSNCSTCHHAASALPSWDARFSTPLEEQRVLHADPYTGPRPDGVQLIVPGDPGRSLIYLRSLSTQPGVRMPPLLRNRVDERYVALLGEWIESLAER